MFNVEIRVHRFYVAHSLHTHMQTLLFCYDMERTIFASPHSTVDMQVNISTRQPEFIPKFLAYNEDSGDIEDNVHAFTYQGYSEVKLEFLDRSIVMAFITKTEEIAPWRKAFT